MMPFDTTQNGLRTRPRKTCEQCGESVATSHMARHLKTYCTVTQEREKAEYVARFKASEEEYLRKKERLAQDWIRFQKEYPFLGKHIEDSLQSLENDLTSHEERYYHNPCG